MSVRVTIVSTALAAVLCATAVAAQETPRMGGVLKVASVGEPPTLDIAMSTAVIVYEIMWHVNESLFNYFTLDMARRDLRGDFRTAPRLYFWNSWLAR
jgi:hypothetical protein